MHNRDPWSSGKFLVDVKFVLKGTVATHCLLEAVVALVTRTRKLKAILLEDRGNEGARVCSKEDKQEEQQCNAGQRQSCTM